MTLASEILDGLNVPGWDASAAAVKTTVRNALRELDRTAEVQDTGFFNHSFVPDFVLSWPTLGDRKRDVFLRMDSSSEFIRGDLRFLGRDRPILMGLANMEEEHTSEPELSSEIAETTTLLVDPLAIEEIAVRSPTADFGQVIPSALLKGGRGWVDSGIASTLVSSSASFFVAARNHDSEQVSAAAPGLTTYLNEAEGERVLRLGRVVWEATGGEPAQFPLATELSGVDDAGLRFLIEQAPADDAAFWRSIGREVSLERLLRLGVSDEPNIGALVRANADRLLARTLLVKASQHRLDYEGPTWECRRENLVMRGADFDAHLAAKREQVTEDPDDGGGLDLPTFRARTEDEQVETVTILADDGKRVIIQSDESFDPSTDNLVATVGDLAGARVVAVGLTMGGRHLECDFEKRIASGNTNANFEISTILPRGLSMLWNVSEEKDDAELAQLRSANSIAPEQPTLFN